MNGKEQVKNSVGVNGGVYSPFVLHVNLKLKISKLFKFQIYKLQNNLSFIQVILFRRPTFNHDSLIQFSSPSLLSGIFVFPPFLEYPRGSLFSFQFTVNSIEAHITHHLYLLSLFFFLSPLLPLSL